MKSRLSILVLTALSFISFNVQAGFFDAFTGGTDTESCTCDNSTNTTYALINGDMEITQQMLTLSMALLNQSQQMMLMGDSANVDYLNAMLSLSTDIGTMADRIGEMADRIVYTEELIGDMADRILVTQQMQSQNLALTQQNLLQAQLNFNALLLQQSQ